MTSREKLHQLVDELSDVEAEAALAGLARERKDFTNARNLAPLALHAKLEFVEVTRAFSYPNVSFDGGCGVLARALRLGSTS